MIRHCVNVLVSVLKSFVCISGVSTVEQWAGERLLLLQALAVVDCLYLAAAALRYPLKYLLTPNNDTDPYVDMQPIVFPLLKTFQVPAQ